jgi:hypothetical protein
MEVSVRDRTAEMSSLRAAGFSGADAVTVLEMMATCRREFDWPQPVLCHGDFLPEHWIIDDANHLSGVIDFGQFYGGPPVDDLALLSMEHPDVDLGYLRAGYGDAPWWGDAFSCLLLLHKVGLQVGYLAHYLGTGNAEEAQPAAQGLRATLDAWRRWAG